MAGPVAVSRPSTWSPPSSATSTNLVRGIEHRCLPDWSAAAPLNPGNVWSHFDDIDQEPGAGLGLRWGSPVDPARLDAGIPLDYAQDPFQPHTTAY